jgi:hypothetical protein
VIVLAKVNYDSVSGRRDVWITLDADNGLFYSKKLDIEDTQYLKNQDYVEARFVPIGKIAAEGVWILPAPPESLSHTFLVRNIRDLIRKYTAVLYISKAVHPDIIFQNTKGDLVALEIETGKHFKKHKARIIEKFSARKIEYGQNLFIILTDTNMKRKYKSLFPDIKILVRTDLQAFFLRQLHINI